MEPLPARSWGPVQWDRVAPSATRCLMSCVGNGNSIVRAGSKRSHLRTPKRPQRLRHRKSNADTCWRGADARARSGVSCRVRRSELRPGCAATSADHGALRALLLHGLTTKRRSCGDNVRKCALGGQCRGILRRVEQRISRRQRVRARYEHRNGLDGPWIQLARAECGVRASRPTTDRGRVQAARALEQRPRGVSNAMTVCELRAASASKVRVSVRLDATMGAEPLCIEPSLSLLAGGTHKRAARALHAAADANGTLPHSQGRSCARCYQCVSARTLSADVLCLYCVRSTWCTWRRKADMLGPLFTKCRHYDPTPPTQPGPSSNPRHARPRPRTPRPLS